jgi:hypothetical protein
MGSTLISWIRPRVRSSLWRRWRRSFTRMSRVGSAASPTRDLRRLIEVVEAITEVRGRVIVGTTKTHQQRSVPIPRFLADELVAQLAGKAPGDLVFTAPEGGGAAEHQFSTAAL